MGKRPTNARTSRIMATEQPQKTFAGPSKTVHADYPLIDNDPHFKRVIGYARTSDYAVGGLAALSGPGLMYAVEKFAPSHAGRGAFPKIMRLAGAIGITGGFLIFYQRSILRFYGATENRREVEVDMREMVDKVKRGESLYGESQLSPHMQGVAARCGHGKVLPAGRAGAGGREEGLGCINMGQSGGEYTYHIVLFVQADFVWLLSRVFEGQCC